MYFQVFYSYGSISHSLVMAKLRFAPRGSRFLARSKFLEVLPSMRWRSFLVNEQFLKIDCTFRYTDSLVVYWRLSHCGTSSLCATVPGRANWQAAQRRMMPKPLPYYKLSVQRLFLLYRSSTLYVSLAGNKLFNVLPMLSSLVLLRLKEVMPEASPLGRTAKTAQLRLMAQEHSSEKNPLWNVKKALNLPLSFVLIWSLTLTVLHECHILGRPYDKKNSIVVTGTYFTATLFIPRKYLMGFPFDGFAVLLILRWCS